jgi:hypothetical protein
VDDTDQECRPDREDEQKNGGVDASVNPARDVPRIRLVLAIQSFWKNQSATRWQRIPASVSAAHDALSVTI